MSPIPIVTRSFLLLAVLLSAAGTPTARAQQARTGAFAYPDSLGTQLLTLDLLDTPRAARWAVCARAAVYPVTYVRTQRRNSQDTGRQTGSNFGNQAGDVYRVVGDRVPEEQTCYLTADSALAASAGPAAAYPRATCDSSWVQRIDETRKRRVHHCFVLAALGPDRYLIGVQFVPIDTSALAALVLVDRNRLTFNDLPATYRRPNADTWRVGDGGYFSSEGLGVLFVARPRADLVLAVTWAGEEGENAFLWAAGPGTFFRELARGYRYWVPG